MTTIMPVQEINTPENSEKDLVQELVTQIRELSGQDLVLLMHIVKRLARPVGLSGTQVIGAAARAGFSREDIDEMARAIAEVHDLPVEYPQDVTFD